MKSIFINAQTEEVKEVAIGSNVLQETYDLIGNGCDIVGGALYLRGNDLLVVDEEGFYKSNLQGFILYGNFYYGNGVIWGSDNDGNNADCQTSVEDVVSGIQWLSTEEATKYKNNILL
jgi:hypothetical protein